MPNWTTNEIRISGPAEVVKKFLADAKKKPDGTYWFSSWIPVPETISKYDTTNHPNGKGLVVGQRASWENDSPIVTEELIEEYKKATEEQMAFYGVVGWYDWNRKYFGCKWDCEVEFYSIKETELLAVSTTPWTAPEAFFFAMTNRYPELEFQVNAKYEDGEWEDFVFTEGSGQVVASGSWDYDDDEFGDEEEAGQD